MNATYIKRLLISLLTVFVTGAVGSYITFTSVSTWYPMLVKPSFNPPSWLFGPVWTVLYILMAIACSLVWNSKTKGNKKKPALIFFFTQIILNAGWSLLFFGLRSPIMAFLEIIILWAAIFITIKQFNTIHKTAALLMIPYLLWTTFAAILNGSIVLLNY